MVLAEEVVASTNEHGLEYFVLAGGQSSWPEVILLFLGLKSAFPSARNCGFNGVSMFKFCDNANLQR